MLESYFEAIRYFKKIINYQSEERSCLAYTWDGLVLEVWNIPSINRCDLGHQFPYIKPRGRNRFHHLILYQPLRSDDIFQRLCAFFFNLNQIFRSQRPLTKEQQYNRQDYTGMSDFHLFLWFDTLRSILLSGCPPKSGRVSLGSWVNLPFIFCEWKGLNVKWLKSN